MPGFLLLYYIKFFQLGLCQVVVKTEMGGMEVLNKNMADLMPTNINLWPVSA